MEDFIRIIEKLRSETGCPWDKEQTHMSLRPCMLEEAVEVIAAIRIMEETGDVENLVEELGDVLLQVIMHAQIGKEEELFTLEDVIQNISEKMIRRHPHVFDTIKVGDSKQVLENWEEIKKKEKENKSYITSPLREIPPELPALIRAPKVIRKINNVYEKQENDKEIIDAAINALESLRLVINTEDKRQLNEKIGQILLATSQICQHYKLSQEQILNDCIEDLIRQYE